MFHFAKVFCALAGIAAVLALPQTAAAQPGASLAGLKAQGTSTAIKVHGRWHDDDGYYGRRHYRRHHSRGHHVVAAPFTRVEHGRRVVVDAPFAHVYVGRRGRHVVAPFVDLWLPR